MATGIEVAVSEEHQEQEGGDEKKVARKGFWIFKKKDPSEKQSRKPPSKFESIDRVFAIASSSLYIYMHCKSVYHSVVR